MRQFALATLRAARNIRANECMMRTAGAFAGFAGLMERKHIQALIMARMKIHIPMPPR